MKITRTRSLVLTFACAISACGPLAASSSSKKSASPAPAPTKTAAPSTAAAPTAAPTVSASGGYTVTFGVGNKVGRLGAVQFEVTAKGGADWQGSAASVGCRNVSGASMMACNDKGGGRLSCAFVDQKGVGTPIDLVVCKLTSSKPVSAGDFAIKVVDASSPDMKPAKASVVVRSIAAN
jgi:hypothetical protein